MTVLYYIKSDGKLFSIARRWDFDEDEKNFKLIADCLIDKSPDQLLESLKKGVPVGWSKTWEPVGWSTTYDVVNPFGDERSEELASVWLFDLETETLFLRKKDGFSSANLALARQRELKITDFTASSTPDPTDHIDRLRLDETWEPDFECISNTKTVARKVLKDFVYTWRHLLRRQQNDTTYSKLAHAVVDIATLNFSAVNRFEFDHSPEYEYVWINELPAWDTPNNNLFRAGAFWVVLTQDVRQGVDLVQQHIKNRNADENVSSTSGETYVVLTLRHIILCRVREDHLEWTRPEVFFDSAETLSDRAVDMLFLAAQSSPTPTLLHKLPLEIQDAVLGSLKLGSAIGRAILACQLGLGSPFMQGDREIWFELEPRKRKRMRHSPPEWQIWLAGGFSGVSYKRRR